MTSDKSILKISIVNSLIKGVGMMMLFLFGIHFQNIGLTGTQMGIAFAIFPIANILTILPSGIGTDRLNAKNLIIIALVLHMIRFFGMAYSDNFLIITVLFLIAGIGQALFKSASEGLFYKTTKNEKVEKKIGTFQGLGYLLIGAGMITSGYFLSIDLSFHKIFLIIGFIYLALILLATLFLPKNKSAKFEIIEYKKEMQTKKALFMLLVVFLFSIHIGAEITSYGLFLKNNLQLTPLNIGLYMGSAVIIMAGAVALISKFSHKIGSKNILIGGLLLSGGGLILMTTSNPWLSFTFRVLHEIGDSAFFFFIFFGILKMFKLERVGGQSGFINFINTLGMTIASFIFSPIGATYGYQWPLIIGGTTSLCSLILVLFYTKLIDHS